MITPWLILQEVVKFINGKIGEYAKYILTRHQINK